MGIYIVASHVEPYNPARAPFTSGTKPSLVHVAQLIEEAETEVHAALMEGGYASPVPATATMAYRQVQTAAAKVAARIVEQVAPNSQRGRIDQLAKMAESALCALTDGQLIGYARDTAEAAPRFAPAASPAFTMDMEL